MAAVGDYGDDLWFGALDVAGIPETTLSPEVLAGLPQRAARAPWSVVCEAVLWWGRADRAALDAVLPSAFASQRPLAVYGGLLRYLRTPVGPYQEIFGGVGLLHRGWLRVHVSFMAVDSAVSLVSGRANWGFPKTLASFAGAPADGMSAEGDGWLVEAVPHARGPVLPAPLLPMSAEQLGSDGSVWTTRMRGRAWARLARVSVEATAAPTLLDWFPTGRCTGAVVARAWATFAPATRTLTRGTAAG